MNKNIINLYDHFKNTPKKLKIICDWDEVIQACESYATWKTMRNLAESGKLETTFCSIFPETFEYFWANEPKVEYSPYGSNYISKYSKEQQQIKNSPDFYQQAPFLTIANDLLKLIKEDKVEQIIFLSAYDKRKFPNGDQRKEDIVRQTFFALYTKNHIKKGWADRVFESVGLELIPFDGEEKGQTKADWIKQNAADFDLVIDDNPNICKKIIEIKEEESADWGRHGDECMGCSDCQDPVSVFENMIVIAPYYPATANQHDERVLLVKNEVSDLKREDFGK